MLVGLVGLGETGGRAEEHVVGAPGGGGALGVGLERGRADVTPIGPRRCWATWASSWAIRWSPPGVPGW